LSVLDADERMDEDVIMGGAVFGNNNDEGGDGESFPILEHV
jgi:hypothetical protein